MKGPISRYMQHCAAHGLLHVHLGWARNSWLDAQPLQLLQQLRVGSLQLRTRRLSCLQSCSQTLVHFVRSLQLSLQLEVLGLCCLKQRCIFGCRLIAAEGGILRSELLVLLQHLHTVCLMMMLQMS